MIKRRLLSELRNHLNSQEITMIVGPRQVGKTTLMKLLEEELKQRGEPTLFLNLDIEEDRRHLSSQSDLLAKIRLEVGSRGYVFIDEIQRKEDAGLFLKGLYDMGLPYKFIVSGSGSVELKERIKESLVGRKKLFELDPVDFEEFVGYRTGYRYESSLKDFFRVEKTKTLELLREYLNYGGYPRVVISETHEKKLEVIEDIFSSYIDRDIREFVSSNRVDVYADLIRLLSARLSTPINMSEISSLLGISTPTLKNYLWYGEKTFILRRISPFFRNRRKELTKMPVYYFVDVGLRNYCLGRFGNLVTSEDFSMVFQNLVYNLLRAKTKRFGATVHFWRTKDGSEVDFVIRLGEKVIPVEVKFQELKRAKVTRSLRSFIRRYRPERAYVVSLSSLGAETVDGCKVEFPSVFELILAEVLI